MRMVVIILLILYWVHHSLLLKLIITIHYAHFANTHESILPNGSDDGRNHNREACNIYICQQCVLSTTSLKIFFSDLEASLICIRNKNGDLMIASLQ